MQSVFRFSSLAAMLALGACATVTRGTTNTIEFKSEPSGATVSTSNGMTCATPCSLTMSRKDEFAATFKLAGHEDQVISVKTQMAAAGAAGVAGNVILGGVVGIVADAATGATLEHVPNPVIAVMKKIAPVAPAARPAARPALRPRPAAPPKVSGTMTDDYQG